jgi:hypothetical protein
MADLHGWMMTDIVRALFHPDVKDHPFDDVHLCKIIIIYAAPFPHP